MQLTQVSRIENDDTDPKASTLNKIITGLGCTANDIFNKPSESQKMNLEEFIDAMDIRTGMDMKTVAVLWRLLDNHALFIQQVQDTYKNDPHPQAAAIKKAGLDLEKYGIKE
jgi:transcriptional regulator with XRE-family HTH domain